MDWDVSDSVDLFRVFHIPVYIYSAQKKERKKVSKKVGWMVPCSEARNSEGYGRTDGYRKDILYRDK